MKLRLIVSEDAERDLDAQFEFLADRSLEAAVRLLDAVQAAYARLRAMPEVGSTYSATDPKLPKLRVWPVPDFPKILIHYRVSAGSVEVVRFLHAAQDRARILGDEDEE
ncbi:MAG: type II toxin-antitoxin system RelE/ParE family toxin [Candidatus Eisenbacteria bacterium]|nr:type II toxin-antitoxin system RelE/ParE family toxin [Candidatus Eisenbacteria bacterium]